MDSSKQEREGTDQKDDDDKEGILPPDSGTTMTADDKTTKTIDKEENAVAKIPEGEECANNEEMPSPQQPPQKKLSKNQLKRQRKFERAMEVKRQKKEHERQIKIAKAKAEGRDIDAERIEMEDNRRDGTGRAKRNAKWNEHFETNSSKYRICVDCSFEDMMTPKEINSLAVQIRYCYSSNKRAKHPVPVTIANLDGKTKENLENVSGFDQWCQRAFETTSKNILDTFSSSDEQNKSKLIYLTSDSDNVLDELEDDKVYIIGGIVDRNRLKRAAIDRAEEYGIATAKLPITEYLSMGGSTRVLTCNHVFDILLKYREHGNDWKKALLDVLPERKDAKAKG